MVGIPRLALVAVVGALPFAGALLAKDAPGEPPRAAVAIAGTPIPDAELQRRAGRYVGADARALATRAAVRARIQADARTIDPAALEQATADTQAFDNVFSRLTERTRSRTTCSARWRHADVCGDEDPAATWWMGAVDIHRTGDRWHATGTGVDWAKSRTQLRAISPFVADRVTFDARGAHARTREHIVTVARAAYLAAQHQHQR